LTETWTWKPAEEAQWRIRWGMEGTGQARAHAHGHMGKQTRAPQVVIPTWSNFTVYCPWRHSDGHVLDIADSEAVLVELQA
jgi:hypothetical protein